MKEEIKAMWIFAALITSLCFGINNSIFKWSSGKGYSKVHIQFFFYFVAFILAMIYGVLVDGLNLNLLSIMLGAAIGVLNANGNIQMASAFEKGPASLTSPLIAANAIFPILCAALIFHEHISSLQWSGIACMLLATLVIQYTPNAKGNHQYLPWIMHTLFSILSFGVLGILMTTSTRLHLNSLDILVSMYGGGTLYLLSALAFKNEKIKLQEVKIGSLVGFLSIIAYGCYFFALNTGIASIIFPVVSLNCLVVVFAGCYLFKEKLKSYQIAGVFAALIGIILTKI
ncbi:DMT family transporter [Peribacillus butanolivorans]|uniref:DMT family transporter n=1 Tax=Peribacillus butanolivorans TaxID=421767 RepID=UPI002E203DF9|nr:DMT family transporter [Peribacillus butanolivorans]